MPPIVEVQFQALDHQGISLAYIFKYIRNAQGTCASFFLPCSGPPLRNNAVYKAENGNVLDFYIEGNVLAIDENREVIALYEGDKENNRLMCNRVLKERQQLYKFRENTS